MVDEPLRKKGLGIEKRTWEKIKTKLKSHFLPPFYLPDSYSQLHNFIQESMNIEEYTKEFKSF